MKRLIFLGIIGLLVSACGSEDSAGNGNLLLSLNGGTAVREGFPHQEGDADFSFVDDWKINFTKYIVTLGNIELTKPGSTSVVSSWNKSAVMDLKKAASASMEIVSLDEIPALRYELSYDFKAVDDSVENRNIDQADFDLMKANQWSFLIEGRAEHSEKGSFTFRFGLPVHTHYYECINGKDQTQGIAIEANKTTGAFIYAHAVHLFWDTLGTGDEDLRFDAFYAMHGDDTEITEEELKAQDLNALKDDEGNTLVDSSGNTIFYNDNGKLQPSEQNLYSFTVEAMRASAHFNGVGLCKQKEL